MRFDAKERDVNDQITLYVSVVISLMLSALAWSMCGMDSCDRARVQGMFYGAKRCFWPSVIRPEFHLWGILRAGATLIVNALLIKLSLRGELSVWVMMGMWIIQILLLFVLHEVTGWWYQRDVDRCWAMHSTYPKDEVGQ